jgi:DNA-binding LacI/PurR family transcriptional regulator
MSIVTVAKIAGVSHATVSRVINRRDGVSVETIKAVQEAMQSVGFVPSDRRPGPKPYSRRTKKRSRIVCLCNEHPCQIDRPAGFELFVRGVESALAKHEMTLNLVFTQQTGAVPQALRGEPPDGLLLHGSLPTGEAENVYKSLPTVWLMANRAEPLWGDQVMPNSHSIGQIAAEYLLARGHRSLAMINLRPGWFYSVRASTFKETAVAAGASCDILMPGSVASQRDQIEAMSRQVDRLLELSPRPTGIFVGDEPQTMCLHSLLHRRGIIPGRDVDLIACNNEVQEYLSPLMPRPATIDIRLELIGKIGVESLLWRMENMDIPGRIVTQIDPLLVPGDA